MSRTLKLEIERASSRSGIHVGIANCVGEIRSVIARKRCIVGSWFQEATSNMLDIYRIDPPIEGLMTFQVTSPARYTQPIPKGVDDYTAGPIMCSASTIYRSIVESNLKPGDWAVFPGGGGGVGIQGVQLAAAMGMRPIVVDTGAEKKELTLKRGAEAFVDFKEVKDVAAEIIKVADGIGAHGVFVTAPSAYGSAISYIGKRVGGSVMCIGLRNLPDTMA
jgi:D-arabinose 1-dehydrogenase-like Zn-dependent alcohol dehydrogenase